MTPFDQVLIALTWTLFHSLWQSALFAILAGIFLSTTKWAKPVSRYNGLCVLLLLPVLTSLLTFCYEFRVQAVMPGAFRIPIKLSPDLHWCDHLPGLMQLGLLLRSVLAGIAGIMSQHSAMIVAIWLGVCLLKTAKMIFALGYTGYIRRYKSAEPSIFWTDRLDALRAQLSIRKPVLLLESALLKIPVVYGNFKPVIFVPLGLLSQIPPGQIEAILLHELAHIRRNDFLINVFQQIAELLFFFNPAVLWLSARIREEREHSCDEMAIEQTGNRRHYAEALIHFAERSLNPSLTDAVAFTGLRTGLMSRVRRLVSKKNPGLKLVEKSALCTCGLALVVFLIFYKAPPAIILSPDPSSVKQTNVDFPLDKVIADISEDLVAAGTIQNKKDLSFELTNTGLVIGGVRQPDALWEKLYSKYLQSSRYPIRPEYREEDRFGIYYDSVRRIYGIGTQPPAWKN